MRSCAPRSPKPTADYSGVTGPIELNAAGDRTIGNYAFYAVCDSDGRFAWEKVGTWAPPAEAGTPGKVKYAGC